MPKKTLFKKSKRKGKQKWEKLPKGVESLQILGGEAGALFELEVKLGEDVHSLGVLAGANPVMWPSNAVTGVVTLDKLEVRFAPNEEMSCGLQADGLLVI